MFKYSEWEYTFRIRGQVEKQQLAFKGAITREAAMRYFTERFRNKTLINCRAVAHTTWTAVKC